MEILSHIGSAKSAEYLIALLGLFSYVAFWRVINGPAIDMAPVKEAAKNLSDYVRGFLVPRDVRYHPGHAWARVEADGNVTVGLDDFAAKLIGKVDSFALPEEGFYASQGEKGWVAKSGAKSVNMVMPVEGQVVAVNEEVKANPQVASEDPYGRGWLLKIDSPNLAANLKNFIPADMVSNWFENIRESLNQRRPAFATMYQDGGLPVDGIARALDPDNWDEIAAEYFLTKE